MHFAAISAVFSSSSNGNRVFGSRLKRGIAATDAGQAFFGEGHCNILFHQAGSSNRSPSNFLIA